MYIRTAFFQGELSADQLAAFRTHMTTKVAPIVRTFPGCQRLQLFWVAEREDTAPNTVLMMQHSYQDRDSMLAALASPQRQVSMQATKDILVTIPCTVYHINHELMEFDCTQNQTN